MSDQIKVKFRSCGEVMELNLKPIISSNLKAYTFSSGHLFLIFKNGGPFLYEYDLTDKPWLEKGFIEAESKGKFFYKYIKCLEIDKRLLL